MNLAENRGACLKYARMSVISFSERAGGCCLNKYFLFLYGYWFLAHSAYTRFILRSDSAEIGRRKENDACGTALICKGKFHKRHGQIMMCNLFIPFACSKVS